MGQNQGGLGKEQVLCEHVPYSLNFLVVSTDQDMRPLDPGTKDIQCELKLAMQTFQAPIASSNYHLRKPKPK